MAEATSLADRAESVVPTQTERRPKLQETTVVQDKPVRLSVDVEPAAYHGLATWCQDIAMKVGRVRVNHVWVVRALIWELFDDKDLQARVIERVREKHGPQAG